MAAGSPPSAAPYQHDPLLHPHNDWELLSSSTASTLLTHSHVLGLGLGLSSPDPSHLLRTPPPNNPNYPIFSPGAPHLPPFDVGEIAAMCSSTSGLEPFTEGWEPQFKIAGSSVLQEDYYGRDHAQRRHTPKRSSPSLENPSPQASAMENDQAGADSSSNRDSPKESQEALDVQKKVKECVAAAKSIVRQKTGSWYGRYNIRCNKSHMVWSVTIAASLLGVFLIVRHTTNASRKISS